MPLKIDLKPGEKLVLNGAVISVGRDGRSLLLQNEAVLLREKDIMQEEDADTPCKRLYFAIMLMYIDPANKPGYWQRYQALLMDLVRAAPLPEFQNLLLDVVQNVASGNYYHALRQCRKLFDLEARLLNYDTQDAGAPGAS